MLVLIIEYLAGIDCIIFAAGIDVSFASLKADRSLCCTGRFALTMDRQLLEMHVALQSVTL